MKKVMHLLSCQKELATLTDIPATPKVAKSVHGLKVKRSKSTSTSKATVKVDLKDGNDTDSSDVFLPCSGIVSGTYDYIFIMT